MTSLTPGSDQSIAHERSPAEPGIWLFIFADMCIFGLYFWIFAWDKSRLPEQFTAGQATLTVSYGAFNTVVLLTSSYFIASAVHAFRKQHLESFRRFIALTIVCGLAFLVVKFFEYAEKFEAGFHIATNVFYRDYFAFTGFHMLHVMIGLGLLSYVFIESGKSEYTNDSLRFIEGCALYWHMVDILWVVLFTLIYLVS